MTRTKILAAGTLIAALSASQAAAADFVVISASKSAPFKEGAVITDKQAIDLPAGASMTLMSDTSAVIPLVGPFSGRVSAPRGRADKELVTVLASLAGSGAREEAKSVGAVRTLGADNGPKSVGQAMAINITSAGPKCRFANEPLNMTRNGTSIAADVALGNSAFEWPAKLEYAEWPSSIGFSNGQPINASVTFPSNKVTSEIQPRLLGPAPERLADRIKALYAAGCTSQAVAIMDYMTSEGVAVSQR